MNKFGKLIMNATSLYVSTCRLVLQGSLQDQSSWTDLYRLVPYLRQSLSCSVCGNLLIEPQTPTDTSCQHHVCKTCKGGRKKLKPSCSWCKDYDKYVENVQLRILLQCYKKLCQYLINSQIYRNLIAQAEAASALNGMSAATSSLMDLIQEGAGFTDDYKSTAGLSKSAYNILPCVYTNSSTQTITQSVTSLDVTQVNDSSPIRTITNGNLLYSVLYTGTGNKITIKRKAADGESNDLQITAPESSQKETVVNNSTNNFKKPTFRSRGATKRKGCRCGNATVTPGKLTCCGQRCPCYVESKPCIECKCRGCRNPHRPDGLKVRPHIPQLQNIQRYQKVNIPVENNITYEQHENVPSLQGAPSEHLTLEDSLMFNPADLAASNIQVVGVYTTHLQDVSSTIPAALLMGDDTGTLFEEDVITSQTDDSSADASDIEVV